MAVVLVVQLGGLSLTNGSPCVPAQVVNVSSNVCHDSISGHEIWLCNSVVHSKNEPNQPNRLTRFFPTYPLFLSKSTTIHSSLGQTHD